MGKAKKPSRADRWSEAVSDARNAADQLQSALSTLDEIHQEYEDWKDNLPENLQSAAVGEKLEAVCEIDVDSAVSSCDDIISMLDEAEGIDLPQGFGRD